MPIAITPDQLAVQASIRDWAKQASPVAAVRHLEQAGLEQARPDPYRSDLADLGIFSIAVPAERRRRRHGDRPGGGPRAARHRARPRAGHADRAGLLLTATQSPLLPALAAGRATGAVGLATGTLTGTRAADGTLRVTGQAGPVLGAGTTSHLILGCTTDEGEAWFWIEAGVPGSRSPAAGRSTSPGRWET